MLNIIQEYFNYQNKFQKKYGPHTIVLMQVGSFHEAYQTNDSGYDLLKLSEILNIIVSKRNKSINEVSIKNPYMMGFPSISLPKYLKILVDNNYTVIIIDQTSLPPNPKREITGIYSPGTYVDEIASYDNNYILSLYLEEIDSINRSIINIICGITLIDLSTGKSIIHEIYSKNGDDKLPLDEIVKFINNYNVKETLLIINNIKSYTINE